MISLSLLGYLLWFLGYPDQALQRIQEGLLLAQELSHPFSLARALLAAIRVYQFRREGLVVQDWAKRLETLSTEHGFALRWATGMIQQGWMRVEQGEGVEGIEQIRQGLAASRATGSSLAKTYHLALLASAYGTIGQADEGLRILAEAQAVMQMSGEHFYEAELYRLMGELLLVGSWEHHAEAETSFQQALEASRRQQAKSLELRAAMSLSRLWQQQGKRDEARALLAPIYGWFTEGFDTADLQEAKVLLETLS